MIVGLIGPSCSGKSFLLNILDVWMGFIVPKGITTRLPREHDNGNLEHVSRETFLQMKTNGKLSMIADVFGNMYAYLKFEIDDRDLGIEIMTENIPELKYYRGVAVKVIPYDLEEGIRRLTETRKAGIQERVAQYMVFCQEDNCSQFDFVFRNKYSDESRMEFIELIKTVQQQRR
jgi:guanylate kinase